MRINKILILFCIVLSTSFLTPIRSIHPQMSGFIYLKDEKVGQLPSTPYRSFTILLNKHGDRYGKFFKKVKKKYRKKKNIEFYSALPFIPKGKKAKTNQFFKNLRDNNIDGVLFIQKISSQAGLDIRENTTTEYVLEDNYGSKLEYVYKGYERGYEYDYVYKNRPEYKQKIKTETVYQPTAESLYRISLMDIKNNKLVWDSIMYQKIDENLLSNLVYKPETVFYHLLKKTMGRLKKHKIISKK